MSRVLIPLADGFEEIEAVTVIDVLRRGGVDVVVGSVSGTDAVTGAHGIVVHVDAALAAVEREPFEMLILPGGEPGTTNLAADACVRRLLHRFFSDGRAVGAICAAPRVLAAEDLIRGRRATSHPSVETQLRESGVEYDASQRVVRDGSVVTSRGPGTALEFALETLALLGRDEQAARLRDAMLVATAPS